MPFVARRVIYKLTAGVSSGTFQVTHPDITNVGCGIVFATGARSVDGALHNDGYIGIGFFDATSQMSMGNAAQFGQGTTRSRRCASNVAVCQLPRSNADEFQGRFVISGFIPGGVECTYEQAFLYDFEVIFTFFEGALNHDLRAGVDLNGGSANIGFKPDLLIAATDTGTFGSISTHAKGGYGVAVRNPSDDAVSQWSQGWENRSSLANVEFAGGLQSGYFILRTSRLNPYAARYAVASFDAAGYTFASAALSLTDVPILALQLPADQQPLVGLHKMRASLGSEIIPTPYAAGPDDSDFVAFHTNESNGLGGSSAIGVHTIGWGFVDSKLEQSAYTFADDFGNGTSQSRGILRNDCVFNGQNGTGTPIYYRADVTSLQGGFTLRSTIIDTGREPYVGWLAIQSPDVTPPGDNVEVDLPAERLGLRTSAPGVQAKDPVNTQLPAERLGLRTSAVTVSTPSNVEVQLLTANMELTPRAPGARTTEHIASNPVTAQLGLTPRSPGVVVEADVDTTLPRVSLALRAWPPSTNDGGGDQSFPPRLALEAKAHEPGVFVEFDVYTQLSTVRYRLGASAPGIYLAGDKISTPATARLRAMASRPRVTVGDPADMGPEDGGAVGPTVTDVVVPPTEQPAVP